MIQRFSDSSRCVHNAVFAWKNNATSFRSITHHRSGCGHRVTLGSEFSDRTEPNRTERNGTIQQPLPESPSAVDNPLAALEPFDLQEFQPVKLLESFPPITEFPVISAEEVGDLMEGKESVIGVERNGEARAYPVRMMSLVVQELLNDSLGGEPILVTWCSRCQDGRVHSRQVEGQSLVFFIPGLMWHSNMVMQDVETRSQWSNMLGKAMKGKLEGQNLELLPSIVTDWDSWRSAYPETTLAVLELDTPRLSQPDRIKIFSDYFYHGSDFVLALGDGEIQKGWRFRSLRKESILNEQLGQKQVLVAFEPDSETATAFDRSLDGEVLQFARKGGHLIDETTNSRWDWISGRAIDGPLRGRQLQRIPSVVTLDEIWYRFFPVAILQ